MLNKVIASLLYTYQYSPNSLKPVDPIPSEYCKSTNEYDVTCFPETGYITMDPKNGKHETTIIYLHGAACYAWYNYQTFADGAATANTRIVMP